MLAKAYQALFQQNRVMEYAVHMPQVLHNMNTVHIITAFPICIVHIYIDLYTEI